jgi:hypothetical protein
MTENINLESIRKEVYLYYSEDGLVDLAIGLVIFGFGALLQAELPALVGALGLIPLLIWYFGKQYLTLPRVGAIQPSRGMKRRFTGFFINMIIIGIGTLVLFLIRPDSGKISLEEYSLTMFGFILALGISTIALIMKTNRYYLYGLLVFVSMALGEFLNKIIVTVDVFLLAVMIAGGMIFLSGIIVLSRFMNKYPVVAQDG